jgi:uncharacterized protein (DUF58 family)
VTVDRARPERRDGAAPTAKELLQRVRRIEITARRAVEETLSGQYHSVFKGRGMAFSEVRPYVPGDEVRSIDWNVSARTGELFVKRFVEERELTVMILCDHSGSADFGSRARTKAEVAAEIAALLALSAVANGDRVGLVLFTDRIERFVPARKGRRHALRLVSEILQLRPEGRRTSLGAPLELLRRALRRRTVAFLVSDFVEGAPGAPFPFERALKIAARKHDLVPVVLRDRLEEELPRAGLAWVEDAETGEAVRVDLSNRRARERFAAELRGEDERLRRLFARLDLETVSVAADGGDPVAPLLAFFRARARRAS